jgi:hypothetical protein
MQDHILLKAAKEMNLGSPEQGDGSRSEIYRENNWTLSKESEARQKRATCVAARFTMYDSKYEGTPDSNLLSVESTMNAAIADYELTQNEARKYAHNYKGDSRRLFDTVHVFINHKRFSQYFR